MKTVITTTIFFFLTVGVVLAATPIEDDPTVDNVFTSFYALTHMGEWLGFNMGDAPDTKPGGSAGNPGRPTGQHIQGVARSPRSHPYPVFYATRSGDIKDTNYLGSLMVIRMYTRDKDGERLRSNRLSVSPNYGHDAETITTPPDWADRVVLNIPFTDYEHPGSAAMAGDILATPLEKPTPYHNPELPPLPTSKVVFFNCANPLNPVRMDYALDIRARSRADEVPWDSADWPDHGGGSVAITRLPEPDGHFLLTLTSGSGDYLEFFRSNKTSFFTLDGQQDPDFKFEPHTRLWKSDLEQVSNWIIDDGDNQTRDDAPFQGLNFIHQTNGGLYLIASRNTNGWSPAYTAGIDAFLDSKDVLYLFEVTHYGSNQQGMASLAVKGRSEVRLRSGGGASWLIDDGWSLPQVYTYWPSGIPWYRPAFVEVETRMQANFQAGGGAYVSPTGELLYYGTHHWNVAPGFGKTSVPMAELRHNQVAHTGTCGPQFRTNHLGGPYLIPEVSSLDLDGTVYHVEPWVQMYQDSNWRGISWMMDWRDQYADWYDNFSKLDGYTYECHEYDPWDPLDRDDGVNDCMSSYRWCGQSGSRLRVFKHDNYDDAKVDKPGSGNVEQIASVGGFNDNATSAKLDWVGPSPQPYAWDLNEDTVFDDAYGATATFHAGVGSSTNTVRMKYWHDHDEGSSTEVAATINVYNVPPTIQSLELDTATPREGQFINLTGGWSDPGASHCRVSVDWGDGSSDEDPDNDGLFSFTHAYGDNGTYAIAVCVSDQEDTVCADLLATASNVAPTAAIDAIDQPNPHFILPLVHTLTYNGSFTDPGWLDTHTTLWDFGDGSDDPGSLVAENDPPDATGTIVTEHYYDDPGTYDVILTVTDDDNGVGTAAVNITVLSAVEAVQVLQDYIATLPDQAFVRNPARRARVLIRKLEEVKKKITAASYGSAINKLDHDVRAKADGCHGGHSKNDWIIDCNAQGDVCMMIDDLIAYLSVL